MAKLNNINGINNNNIKEVLMANEKFEMTLTEKLAAISCTNVEETTASCFFDNVSDIIGYVKERCVSITKDYYGRDNFLCIDFADNNGLHYVEVFVIDDEDTGQEELAATYCGSIPFNENDAIIDGIMFAIRTNNVKVDNIEDGVLVFRKNTISIEENPTGDDIVASVDITEEDAARALTKMRGGQFFFVFNLIDEYNIIEEDEDGEEYTITESDEGIGCIIAKSYDEAYQIAMKECNAKAELLWTCPVAYAMKKVKSKGKDKVGYVSVTNVAIALEHLFTPSNCYQTYFDYEVADALGLTQEEE